MERWLGEARDRGAQLAVFPEYAAMELAAMAGPDAAAQVASALAAVSERMPAADEVHQDLARRFGLHIIAGSGPLQGADGRYRNVARLFAPNGKSGIQEKLIADAMGTRLGVGGWYSGQGFSTPRSAGSASLFATTANFPSTSVRKPKPART